MGHDILVDMPPENEKSARVQISPVSPGAEDTKMHIGRRRTDPLKSTSREVGYDGEQNTLNTLGKMYTRIRDFNVITRNIIYIVPVAILLAIPLVIFATAAKEARAGGVRLLGLFIWIQVMWWSFWLTKAIAQTMPFIFQFLVGFVSSGTRKYRLLIKAMEIPIAFMLWTIVSYFTVPLITVFDQEKHNRVQWVRTFQRFLLASVAVAALFVAQKLIVQLITVNYHRRQFNARVNDSKLKVRMLDGLLEASLKMFPLNTHPFEREDFEIMTGIDAAQQEISSTKVVGGLAMYTELLQSTVGNITSEITGARSKQSSVIHNLVVEALESKRSSRALGARLWQSFVMEGKDALFRSDVEEILGEARKEEANEIFNLLDQDNNGDVSLDEMVMATLEISRERKAIAASMHDVGQAVRVLDRFLFLVALILLGIVYAAFFSESFAKYMFTIGTQLAAISFAIATTVQEFLGSCIFVFVKHPYDVGDMVVINDVRMIVEHISLLYSTFKRVDNSRMIQIPNIINNNNWIDNVTRSKQMKEQIDISVNAETSFADIEVFKMELATFLALDENKRDFHNDVELQITQCKDLKQIDMTIGVSHKSNWANEELRLTRRNKLMTAILSCLRCVPIYPVGSDKPLAIHRPTKEIVEAAREAVIADQEALKVLKETLIESDQDESTEIGVSSSVNTLGLNVQVAESRRHSRASMESRRSASNTRHNIGVRRAGQAPDGLE
ncbi:uncharacterized protein PV09_04345 [Verruconis gallopava]|uniref:EF-hand domain-containing protein n=1 Tax=Verruconis gallopava TaxID=253628 RepID=A0A0D1YVA4_9PEZI|nr:uncharacterized protein PV09_04345 [Verruconis gallopava]KIW04597.1 hypothetical protein PV09_04345 [Verruconis gallopava]